MVAQRQDNPPASPWVWTSGSDWQGKAITLTFGRPHPRRGWQGKAITLTFEYDNSTHALGDLTTQRDTGCVWSKLEIGLGGQRKTITIPAGQRVFTPAQIAAATTFTSIDQIWALNITVA
jgi:hypothetical protein